MPSFERRPPSDPFAPAEKSSNENDSTGDAGGGVAEGDGNAVPPDDDPSLDGKVSLPDPEHLLVSLGHFAETDEKRSAQDDDNTEAGQRDGLFSSVDGPLQAGPSRVAPTQKKRGATKVSDAKPNAILKVVVVAAGDRIDSWESKAVWVGDLPEAYTANRVGKTWRWDNAAGKSVKVKTNAQGQGGVPVEDWASNHTSAMKIVVYAQAIEDVTVDDEAEDNDLAPGHAKNAEDAADGSSSRLAPDKQGPGTSNGTGHEGTNNAGNKSEGSEERESNGGKNGKDGGTNEDTEIDADLDISDAEELRLEEFETEMGMEEDEGADPDAPSGDGREGSKDGDRIGSDAVKDGTGPGGDHAKPYGDGEGSKDGGSGGTEEGTKDGEQGGADEGMVGGEGSDDHGVVSGNSFGLGLLGVPKALKGLVEVVLLVLDGDITGSAADLFKQAAKTASKTSVKATRKALAKQARAAARRQTKKAIKQLGKSKKWNKASKLEKKAAQRRLYWEYQRAFFSEAQKQARLAQKRAKKVLKKNPTDAAARAELSRAMRIDEAANVKPVAGRLPQNHKFAGKPFPDKKLPKQYRASSGGKGVKFSDEGFPDFSPYAKQLKSGGTTVQIKYTGSRKGDFAAANTAAGYKKTPAGYVWHHLEDGKTMMLVPEDLHDAVKHTGGVAMHKNNTGAATYGD